MGDAEHILVDVEPSIGAIDAMQWDACAAGSADAPEPFVSHAFLSALEDSGSAVGEAGWYPRHLVMRDGAGEVTACAPAYVKTHSQGEFVFDHGWADAYERAGGQYYPKLQIAVPFTPVTGRRLLVRPGPDAHRQRMLLARAAVKYTSQLEASTLHITFLEKDEWEALGEAGFLQRTDQQFHWENRSYETFDDFLATLTSRKRKLIRRERRDAGASGLTIERLTGRDLSEADWDSFYAFYMDTGSRKWGRPYLTRAFFSQIGRTMADEVLLVAAKRDDKIIAGGLNFVGADTLYGRYWGAIEEHPFLHFEVCYYQAIEHAIASGLKWVEAGAQGPHKLARGYLPVTTYSAHWIADPGLRGAIEHYLRRERAHVEHDAEMLKTFAPYRKGD